ncbi:MAG: RNA 2',3'-cyclic phosphodiesterase [Rhodospirillales bacterium]
MRLFVGVPLPQSVRDKLSGLNAGLAGARWVDGENLHITLGFIGNVDNQQALDIDDALSDIRFQSFELGLAGLGCFESRRKVRALWAGVGESEPLKRLKAKVDKALDGLGIDFERRKFKPHVTMARFRNVPAKKIVPYLETHNGFTSASFPVNHFTLFRSHLSHSGARYEALARYRLDEKQDAN